MIVKINSKEQFNPGKGKTTEFDSVLFEVSATPRYIRITGKSTHAVGDGSRGGEDRNYDRKLTIQMTPGELKLIISKALALKTITLDSPEKAKMEKAQKLIEEALKVLSNEKI